MEGLYIAGNKVANEKLTEEITRLKKRTNLLIAGLIITIVLVVAVAVIYFLNIPVTPYQTGSKSLFGAGKNTPNANELNANLTKRLLAVEDQLQILQDQLAKVSTSTQANKARAKAVDKKSDLYVKKLNESLTKNSDKMEQEISKMEENLQQNVQAVNMTTKQNLGKVGQEMEELKKLVQLLQETDAAIIDNTTASLDGVKDAQNRLSERMQQTKANMMTKVASVQGTVRNLSNELNTLGKTLQDQRNETAQLRDQYVGIRNHIVNIKASSANQSALDDVKAQLEQYHSHVTGNITGQLEELENKALRIALATQQNNEAALANITDDLQTTQGKVDAVSRDVDALRNEVATEFTNVREEVALEANNAETNTNDLRRELQGIVQNVRDQVTAEATQTETNVNDLKLELLGVVQNLTEEFYPRLEKLGKSLSGNNEALNRSIASDLQSTQDKVETVSENVVALRMDLVANITSLKEDATNHATIDQANLATLKGELMDSVQDLNATVFPHLVELEKSLGDNIEKLNGTIATKLTSLPTRLVQLEDKLDQLANNVSTQLKNNFITNINTNEGGEASVAPQTSSEEILAAIQPKLDKITQSVQAKIDQLGAEVYKNMTIEAKNLNDQMIILEAAVAEGNGDYGEQEPEG